MPYDYSKLYGLIVEKYGTQAKFAKALGISERSLSLKLTGKRPWKQPQISRSCELLGISDIDLQLYFFTIKVQLN